VLQNVCSLKTVIIALKTVKAHETIGYSRRTKLTSDRLIAVIPIGYADGLDRRLSNYNGSVIVRGKKCPIVGNICMDQAMVDVTDTDAQVGDRVVLFDDVQSINALAEQLGTIPYEIITSISRRVKRVYANGSF
jgi:alanine racemase